VKPLIYGYMRVPDEAADDEIERAERELMRYADAEGFCYATTFYEYQSGAPLSVGRCNAVVQRAGARDRATVTPSGLERHWPDAASDTPEEPVGLPQKGRRDAHLGVMCSR